MTTFINEYMDELVSQAGYDKTILTTTWDAIMNKKPTKKIPSWVDKQECNAQISSGKNKGQKCTKLVVSGTSKCKLHNKCNVVTATTTITDKVEVVPVQPVVVKPFASLHEITLSEAFPDVWEPAKIAKIIKKYVTSDWMRGDVIGIKNVEDYGYRNVGKYMWDGKKLVELSEEFDEYGHVPYEFLVGKEFHAMYWRNTIVHNELVCAKFVKKDMKNVKLEDDSITFDYVTNGVTNTWYLVGKAMDDCWNYYNGQDIEIPKGVKPYHVLVGVNYEYE